MAKLLVLFTLALAALMQAAAFYAPVALRTSCGGVMTTFQGAPVAAREVVESHNSLRMMVIQLMRSIHGIACYSTTSPRLTLRPTACNAHVGWQPYDVVNNFRSTDMSGSRAVCGFCFIKR